MPRLKIPDDADVGLGYAILGSDFLLCPRLMSNSVSFFLSKFGSWMSTFSLHVAHIVRLRTGPQMSRVAASGLVTPVADQGCAR
jgi:hypothetical protein